MAYTTIDDPTKYFQVIKYVGNGTDDRAMTFDGNSDMQPDWFLTKRYDSGSDHWDIQDTCRGLVDGSGDGVSLYPASTNTENSDTGKIKITRPSPCLSCRKKRENVRTDIASHPIYHILSFACFVDQQVWIDFNRKMLSFSRAFDPSKESHPEGIISMASSEAIISMDLGEIFNSIAYLNDFEGTESTIVQCYNSYGHKLLSLIQQNTELLDFWSLISARERHQ